MEKSFEKGIQSRAVHARLRGAVLHGGGDNAAYGIFLYGHRQKLPVVARFRSERFRAGDFAHGAFRRAYEHVLRDERQPRREVVLCRKDVAAFDKRDYGRENRTQFCGGGHIRRHCGDGASCKKIRVGGRRRIRVFRRRDDGVVADTVRHKKGSEQSAVFAGRRQRRERKQQQRVDNRRDGACVRDASWRNTPFRQRIVERQGQRYALVYLRFRERVRGGGVCRLAFILSYRDKSPL